MQKHFLDTSIVRPLIASSSKAKGYYNSQLGSDRYISEYIKMEYIRGFIMNLMDFYGVVLQPNSKGYSDALFLWTNKFSGRSVKAVLSFAAGIQQHFETNTSMGTKFNTNRNFQSSHLGDCIKRLFLKIESFQNTNSDKNLCYRTKFKLNYNPNDIHQTFIDFIQNFKNKRNSKLCGLSNFLTKRKTEFDCIVNYTMKKEPDSIKKIKAGITKLRSKQITCTKCSKAGDAIICMQTPHGYQLEHTDSSFDILAAILGTPHRRLPSETAIP